MRRSPIYKRGDVYWCQYQGKRRSLKTTDREAAKLAFAELQRKLADPSYARAHTVTVAEACKAWGESLLERPKPPAAGTLEMYGYHMGHFRRIFRESTPLAALDAEAIDAYVAKRRSEYRPGKDPNRSRVGPNTVSKELWTLRKILTYAKRRGWYHQSLDAVMPDHAPPDYEPLDRALTWEQVPLLLRELTPARRAIAAFVIGLGADKCAVPRAQLVDFGEHDVLVRGTKNSKRWARVPIVPPFAALVRLARWWLWRNGSFPDLRNWSRELAYACGRAGLPRVTLRDLRRTHGKVLRARGVSPQLIGAMLRHADGRMAERVYAQLGAQDLGKLVASESKNP